MKNIELQLSSTVQGVVDGELNPLEVYGNLKMLEKHLAKCIDEIKDCVFSEADKWTEKTFEESGFKFTKTDGRALYDFKGLKTWNKKKDELKKIEDMAKASAQNWVKFKSALVTEDGELIEPCKISHTSPSISVSIAK